MGNLAFGREYGFLEEQKDVEDLIDRSTQGISYFAVISQIPWADNFLDKNPVKRLGPASLTSLVLLAAKFISEYKQKLEAEGSKAKHEIETLMDKVFHLKETHPDTVGDKEVLNYLMLNVLAGG